MTEMKVKYFDNIPKHYQKNPEKLFNRTFLMWFGVGQNVLESYKILSYASVFFFFK